MSLNKSASVTTVVDAEQGKEEQGGVVLRIGGVVVAEGLDEKDSASRAQSLLIKGQQSSFVLWECLLQLLPCASGSNCSHPQK